MAINTLAPMGLIASRNLNMNAPTYQANRYTLLKSYSTKIGLGDVVASAGGNTGYIALPADNPTLILGVFAGVEPYFDLNLSTTVFTQWWTGTQNPSADVGCFVYDDPTIVFRAQVVGGPFAQSWRGQNTQWTGSTNGAPNQAGISTLSLSASVATTSANYSFRVMGVVGMSGGPQDPANTNPWIEVAINSTSSERVSGTGV